MPWNHEKINVLELSERRRVKYRQSLISKGLASRLIKMYPVGEALKVAGLRA